MRVGRWAQLQVGRLNKRQEGVWTGDGGRGLTESSEGLTFAMMYDLEFPPSESFRRKVNRESR